MRCSSTATQPAAGFFLPFGQEEKNAMRAVLTKEEAEELFFWDRAAGVQTVLGEG